MFLEARFYKPWSIIGYRASELRLSLRGFYRLSFISHGLLKAIEAQI